MNCSSGFSFLTKEGCVPNTQSCGDSSSVSWSTKSVADTCKSLGFPNTLCKDVSCAGKNDGTMAFRCCCPSACAKVDCRDYLDKKACPLNPREGPNGYAWDDGSNEFNCCCPKVTPFDGKWAIDNKFCAQVAKIGANTTCGGACSILNFLECDVANAGCLTTCPFTSLWDIPGCFTDCNKQHAACHADNFRGCNCNCASGLGSDINNVCNDVSGICSSIIDRIIPETSDLDPSQICSLLNIGILSAIEVFPEATPAILILYDAIRYSCPELIEVALIGMGGGSSFGVSFCKAMNSQNNTVSKGDNTVPKGDNTVSKGGKTDIWTWVIIIFIILLIIFVSNKLTSVS